MRRIDLAISSAPSPVGAGARATGFGSAFVALADDATAASWNPAGLVQLERPELSAVMRSAIQTDEFGRQQFESGEQSVEKDVGTGRADATVLQYLSAAVPFNVRGANVVASLNYQQTYAFEREFSILTTATSPSSSSEVARRFAQDGSIFAVSPACALEIGSALSVGAAFNYSFDGAGRSYAWRSRVESTRSSAFGGGVTTSSGVERYTQRDFEGLNLTMGALGVLPAGFRVGAVAKTAYSGSFEQVYTSEVDGRERSDTTELRISFPWSYGVGLAWRSSDRFALAADVTRVEWSRFRLEDAFGNRFLVSGDPIGADNPFAGPNDPPNGYHVDDTITVRLGAEQTFLLDELHLSARAGLAYDPEPSRGVPEDCYTVSAGLGLGFSSLTVDMAYEARFGRNVDGVAVLRNVLEAPSEEIDVVRHSLYLSLVYYL